MQILSTEIGRTVTLRACPAASAWGVAWTPLLGNLKLRYSYAMYPGSSSATERSVCFSVEYHLLQALYSAGTGEAAYTYYARAAAV